MQYVVEADHQGDADIVVHLNGKVDYSTVGSFTSMIETVQELAPKRLRLNLSKVDGIDSVGFGLLIMLREAVPASRIVLSGAAGATHRLLGLFEASSLFEVTP